MERRVESKTGVEERREGEKGERDKDGNKRKDEDSESEQLYCKPMVLMDTKASCGQCVKCFKVLY